jgi:DNA-binding transcriptional ArsR family regulator
MAEHYMTALGAIADETRREILSLLQQGEQTVGALAAALPVTRPAVSQHLKVLRRAGLVEIRTAGTRHYYRLAPGGLQAVRTSIEELWGTALDHYAAAAQESRRRGGLMTTAVIAPVLKTIVVPLPPDQAFELFFTGIAAWWPLESHSVYGSDAASITVEARPGGHILESSSSGRTSDWGEILVWDEPRRAVFTWHPGYDDDAATEVEIRFSAEGRLTRVDLEHRGWAALGERAEATRDGYETGWNFVFAVRYGRAALETDPPGLRKATSPGR